MAVQFSKSLKYYLDALQVCPLLAQSVHCLHWSSVLQAFGVLLVSSMYVQPRNGARTSNTTLWDPIPELFPFCDCTLSSQGPFSGLLVRNLGLWPPSKVSPLPCLVYVQDEMVRRTREK